MDERQLENGEEEIDESGRNMTQQRLDERGVSQQPVDVPWETGEAGSDEGGPGSQNM
jgi:hypothetical protein